MNITGEINYLLENDHASLKFSETRESISIDTVMVPASFRGKGIETFLVNRILYIADSLHKTVYLSARPIGAFSDERLVSFYRRRGLEVYDRGVTTAYRRRDPPSVK